MCLISRYCDLLKIKIFYVYIELFRTIILTSSPSITNTFKRIITSKYLCKVRFWFLVNILRKQDEAEWAFDSTQKPSVVCNQLWVKGLGRYACDMDWHPRYWVSLMITEIALKMVRTCCLSSWHICYPKKVYWIRCCEGFSVVVSSGMWHHAYLQEVTEVSEEHDAHSFCHEDGGGIFPSIYCANVALHRLMLK